jgi:GPH family glycoside/pentoside/hexuronide:cation symporter
MGLNLCGTMLGLHLLYFYTDRKHLAPSLVGLVLFTALCLDALTDPLIGNISDRARFKSGRRRPFFLVGAIPMGICFFMLLSPPNLGPTIFVWFLGFYFLMLTSRKIYETSYSALMPEITLDYDERTRLSTFRQLLGTFGDIGGALIPFAATFLLPQWLDFRAVGATAGIVVAGGAIVVYAGIRERPEFALGAAARLSESIKSVWSNEPFRVLLAATMLAFLGISIPGALLRFLAKYWMRDEGAGALWLIAYFAGSIVSYPIWFRVTVAIEKKPAFVVAMVCNAAGALMFLLLTPSNRYLLEALMAFVGFSAIGIWVTQIAASADVIEWDQMHTGKRQEGAYAGVMSMAVKLSVALSFIMIGPMLTWVGYVPGVTNMTAQAAENMRKLFVLLPAAIYVLSAGVFMRYPITRQSHRQMREHLAAKEVENAAKAMAT